MKERLPVSDAHFAKTGVAMRYFNVGVVMIVVGVPFGLGTLSGAGLIVAGGLCFVADAITRLTEELREQSQCAEAVETMRR